MFCAGTLVKPDMTRLSADVFRPSKPEVGMGDLVSGMAHD